MLYIKVTQDEFQLPVIVADTPKELAEKEGVTPNAIRTALAYSQKRKVPRYVRVKIDEQIQK